MGTTSSSRASPGAARLRPARLGRGAPVGAGRRRLGGQRGKSRSGAADGTGERSGRGRPGALHEPTRGLGPNEAGVGLGLTNELPNLALCVVEQTGTLVGGVGEQPVDLGAANGERGASSRANSS